MGMCERMGMLTRRLHILLDEPRYRRLAREAKRQGTSVSTVVRHAIDTALPSDLDETRMTAMQAFLAADPMPVPRTPADLRAEVDVGHLDRRG